MSLVALSQQDEYGLAHSDQDCRGWAVRDAAGTVLGTCTDMIVDTEAEHIDSIVLDTGATIAAADISLESGTVLVRSSPRTGNAAARLKDDDVGGTRVGGQEDITLPVIEERIKVGKREVAGGGVRVSQRVSESPVEENITLRDERVYVERRPVNQPASTVGADAFKDGVIEVTETDEEAVIAKRARVVEEVTLNKEATERQEVIRDTVKRTDVEVETLDVEGGRVQDRTVASQKKTDR